MSETRYQRPGAITRHVMNPLVAALTRAGLPLAGSAVLGVRGRGTGQWRTTPVNPLHHGGERYLVAARGETQWVRNVRVHAAATLTVGRRTEEITLREITDPTAAVPVLRAYLRRWAWEVGAFFDGVGADSPDDELAAAAARHPVFLLSVR